MPTLQAYGLDDLSPEDRLTLAEKLWDSVAADLEAARLTPAQRTELERRIALADADPNRGIPWEQVRAEAEGEVTEMSLPVILDPEARDEFDEAYDWYEAQRPGLGDTFSDAVNVVLAHIGSMPRIHQIILGSVRKAVVRRFPYCVYYREETAFVRVLAVFHTSRDPKDWERRA